MDGGGWMIEGRHRWMGRRESHRPAAGQGSSDTCRWGAGGCRERGREGLAPRCSAACSLAGWRGCAAHLEDQRRLVDDQAGHGCLPGADSRSLAAGAGVGTRLLLRPLPAAHLARAPQPAASLRLLPASLPAPQMQPAPQHAGPGPRSAAAPTAPGRRRRPPPPRRLPTAHPQCLHAPGAGAEDLGVSVLPAGSAGQLLMPAGARLLPLPRRKRRPAGAPPRPAHASGTRRPRASRG